MFIIRGFPEVERQWTEIPYDLLRKCVEKKIITKQGANQIILELMPDYERQMENESEDD